MRFEEGNIYFNKIYIIQSLRHDDRKTGEELYTDIIRRRTSKDLAAELINISARQELIDVLKKIFDSISESSFLPWIHFETHGFKGGIQLGDLTDITWEELVPYFRAINIATKNNLFISMAACQGGNIQFCVKITEQSPFRGFIGPMDDVSPYDLLNSYSEFFNIFLTEGDFEKGLNALNLGAKEVQYHHMNTEVFMEKAWEFAAERWKNDPTIWDTMIDGLLENLVSQNPHLTSRFGGKTKLRNWIEDYARTNLSALKKKLKHNFCHLIKPISND